MEYQVIITANGSGERMKAITDGPKFSLFYKEKRILQHLLDIFPTAKVLTHYEIPYINPERIIKCPPTNSRRETLEFIKDMENVMIVDADIYLEKFGDFESQANVIFWKHSDNMNTQKIPSGVYFIKSVKELLAICKLQNKDDIVNAGYFTDNYYLPSIHLGTIPEYYAAILGE